MGRGPLRQREDSLQQTILEPTFLSRQVIRLGPSLPGDNFSGGKIRWGDNKFAENMRAEKLHSTIRLLAPHYLFLGDNIIYFKSVLRWEPANATGFSSRTRVPRYHYLGVLVL